MRRKRLEEEEAQLKGEFIGLFFNGEKGYVSVKPSRLLKLRAGVQDLLNRQFCTGHTVQLVLGHCTWAMMARRESLSLLHHSYSFCHQHFNQPTRIWPSVRQELHWIISILPLLRCKINNGWSCDVTASDSSPWGLGVCERKISTTTAAELGSVSERWRFQFEDATRARKHALDSLTVNGSGVDGGTGSCERVDVNDDVQMKQSEQGSCSSLLIRVLMKFPAVCSLRMIGMLFGHALGSMKPTSSTRRPEHCVGHWNICCGQTETSTRDFSASATIYPWFLELVKEELSLDIC